MAGRHSQDSVSYAGTQTLAQKIQNLPAAELLIFGVLIVAAKTTAASGQFLNPLAYFLIGTGALVTVFRFKYALKNIVFPLATLSIYLFGCALSYFNTPYLFPPPNMLEMSAVIFVGSLAITSQRTVFKDLISLYVVGAICMIYLIASYYSDGLTLGIPPQFQFETYDDFGIRIRDVYSQGISKLFSIAAIIFLYSYINRNSKSRKYDIILLLSIISLTFSFLSGARGEFIALILIILLILVRSNISYLILFLLLSISALYILPTNLSEQIVLLNRFENLLQDDTLGGRTELFENAVTLLDRNPTCLLTGCGNQFYQNFWGYRIGLYPHNYILDLLISHGLLFTFLIYFIYLRSAFWSLATSSYGVLGYISIYLFIVSMKSGSPSVDHIFWVFFSALLAIWLQHISLLRSHRQNSLLTSR